AVRVAADGQALDRCLAEAPADLVLLDVNMPGEDGFTVARRLRAGGANLAIIMVTAAGEVVDRVVGLEIGADDYVTKPFDLRELRARVRTVLRRSRAVAPAPAAASPPDAAGGVRFGAMTLDLAARRLLGPDGGELKLTAMEFD